MTVRPQMSQTLFDAERHRASSVMDVHETHKFDRDGTRIMHHRPFRISEKRRAYTSFVGVSTSVRPIGRNSSARTRSETMLTTSAPSGVGSIPHGRAACRTAPSNMGAPRRVKVAPRRAACLATNNSLRNSEPGAGAKCALAEVARGSWPSALRRTQPFAMRRFNRSSPDGLDDFAPPVSGFAVFIETTS
jgi:hypothetical protein